MAIKQVVSARLLSSLRHKDFHQEVIVPAGDFAFAFDVVCRGMLLEQADGAGWPWAVARPGLPQIRMSATRAYGSSSHGFAALRYAE